MGIKFRLRVFLKVGEGDVRVPPVGHRVVEDPVEGHEVVRGGEGGAAVVVAGCLSPNHRPHLVVIGRSVVGSSFPKRLARQTEVIWFGQAAKQRTNFHQPISVGPSLVTCFALAGFVRGSQVHVNLFTSPRATTTALAAGGLINCNGLLKKARCN